MASNVTVKINRQSLERSKKQLEGLFRNLGQELANTTTEFAKEMSPFLTGHNRSTITWDEQDGAFRVFTQSGYGGYLEVGTAKMPARPYITPAFRRALQSLG